MQALLPQLPGISTGQLCLFLNTLYRFGLPGTHSAWKAVAAELEGRQDFTFSSLSLALHVVARPNPSTSTQTKPTLPWSQRLAAHLLDQLHIVAQAQAQAQRTGCVGDLQKEKHGAQGPAKRSREKRSKERTSPAVDGMELRNLSHSLLALGSHGRPVLSPGEDGLIDSLLLLTSAASEPTLTPKCLTSLASAISQLARRGQKAPGTLFGVPPGASSSFSYRLRDFLTILTPKIPAYNSLELSNTLLFLTLLLPPIRSRSSSSFSFPSSSSLSFMSPPSTSSSSFSSSLSSPSFSSPLPVHSILIPPKLVEALSQVPLGGRGRVTKGMHACIHIYIDIFHIYIYI